VRRIRNWSLATVLLLAAYIASPPLFISDGECRIPSKALWIVLDHAYTPLFALMRSETMAGEAYRAYLRCCGWNL